MSGAAVDVEVRVSALRAAVADLADLAWGCVPVDVADAVLADLEVAQRTLKAVGYAAINRVKDDAALGRGRRLRDLPGQRPSPLGDRGREPHRHCRRRGRR